MKPVESYEIKFFLLIFYITISSCDLRGPMASKSVEPNDFDADWEN
jgi:hypothetical protein